uniref:Uncharacterized protein n=1 Tax=Arundo donax TaxID=35708 RepID=A0A0A8Z0K3_ARUDO
MFNSDPFIFTELAHCCSQQFLLLTLDICLRVCLV